MEELPTRIQRGRDIGTIWDLNKISLDEMGSLGGLISPDVVSPHAYFHAIPRV